MKKILKLVVYAYQCKICHTEYDTPRKARQCERRPRDRHYFKIGDIVQPIDNHGKVRSIILCNRCCDRTFVVSLKVLSRSKQLPPEATVVAGGLLATSSRPALIRRGKHYLVYRVRARVLPHRCTDGSLSSSFTACTVGSELRRSTATRKKK